MHLTLIRTLNNSVWRSAPPQTMPTTMADVGAGGDDVLTLIRALTHELQSQQCRLCPQPTEPGRRWS